MLQYGRAYAYMSVARLLQVCGRANVLRRTIVAYASHLAALFFLLFFHISRCLLLRYVGGLPLNSYHSIRSHNA